MEIDSQSGFAPGANLQSDGTVDVSASVTDTGAPQNNATFSVIGPNGRSLQLVTANQASTMNCGVDANDNAEVAQFQGSNASCGFVATGQVVNIFFKAVSVGPGQYRIVVQSAGSPTTSVKGATFNAQSLG